MCSQAMKLVEGGLLEFIIINGGWCMNDIDEAATDYNAIINQLSLGERLWCTGIVGARAPKFPILY